MAKLPIELIPVGGASVKPLERIVTLLNKSQDAFEFSVLSDEIAFQFKGATNYCFTTSEIHDQLSSLKKRIKGYHPHLIGIVDRRLDGKKFGNLFGSLKQENAQLEGMAIFSLYQIPNILEKIPIDIYSIFEILSFSIRFLHGEGLIHDERRNCVFDRKVKKLEIVEAIKVGKFCNTCEEFIKKILDEDQEIAVERIFRLIKDIANSHDPDTLWNAELERISKSIPRIFLCHSSRDKEFVRRIANDLVNRNCRVWFDEWDIKIGDNIVQKINEGLKEADYLAVVVSLSAMNSVWVNNELSSKLIMTAEKKKATILPLLIEDCDIPPLLRPLKYADFRNEDEYQNSLDMVLKTVFFDYDRFG